MMCRYNCAATICIEELLKKNSIAYLSRFTDMYDEIYIPINIDTDRVIWENVSIRMGISKTQIIIPRIVAGISSRKRNKMRAICDELNKSADYFTFFVDDSGDINAEFEFLGCPSCEDADMFFRIYLYAVDSIKSWSFTLGQGMFSADAEVLSNVADKISLYDIENLIEKYEELLAKIVPPDDIIS